MISKAQFLLTCSTRKEAMNGALERSGIPIQYRQWGSVQMLDQTHDYIRNKHGDNNENKMFLNSKGDSEEARQSLKQSADHMVIILNEHLEAPSGVWSTRLGTMHCDLGI